MTEGIQLFEQEKFEQALEKFKNVIEADPDNPEANLFLGMTYSKLESFPKALDILHRASIRHPQNIEILLNLGITHYSLSEFETALDILEKVLKIDPGNASSQLFKGLCQLALGEHEKAIQSFDSAHKINPEFEQLSLFNQGLAHFKNESFEQAQKMFQAAIDSNPDTEMVVDAKEFLAIVKKEKRNKKRLKLHANVSLIFDDNVILEEQDSIANEEDYKVYYNAGGNFRLFSIAKVEFYAGYDYSKLLYRRISEFDSESHAGYTSFSYDDEKWDIKFTYSFNYSYLDRQDFLASNSFTPSFGFSITPDHYTSISYTHMRKNFLNGSNDRDAIYNYVGINQFWFFWDSKAFLSLGYGFAVEDTQEPRFDYTAHSASMGLKLPLFAKVSANFNYYYNYQDYKNITASIGEQRFDASHFVGLNFNIPLNDSLDLNLSQNRTMSNSNLQTIDFVQNVSTVNLNYRF